MRQDIAIITGRVHSIAVGPEGSPGRYPPNIFLITGDSNAVFVDTAYGSSEEMKAALGVWQSNGALPVSMIALSHRHQDHIGGAHYLSEATGGPVVAHADEIKGISEQLPTLNIDSVVEEGQTVCLGKATLEFIHTPGHTMGSICVFYREERVLFTGDTILGGSSTAINPDQGDMGLYIESLKKLLTYDLKMICPGHGPIIRNPEAKITSLIEHRQKRENQILDLLESGTNTTEALFLSLYVRLNPALHDSARSQVRTHLKKLEKEGRVKVGEDGVFRLV